MKSPPSFSEAALKKWLKPTSYNVEEEAKLPMWPPRSKSFLEARNTNTKAFQRIAARMRDSMV